MSATDPAQVEAGTVLSSHDLMSEHEGLPATLLGQWEVSGTLHYNRRSKVWTLSIPRPRRKDRRPDLISIWSGDEVRIEAKD